jgi:uncharacterized protein YegJ (DUF2314 family)
MIHNHSSGKHGLLRKMLAVCIAFAMICSVSISAFSVEASSENTDETVQSVMTEEEGDPEAAEAETDSEQTPGEEQTEEPEVTPPEDNVENPDADNAEPTPSEDNEQPADPTVTEQPEEPTVTEQPTATPTQVEELEKDKADSEVQTQDAKAKWPTPTPASSTTYSGKAAIYYLANPAGDPWTNDTGAWAPAQETSNTIGNINTDGATWEDGYVGNTVYKEKNIKSNVSKYITSWPDGSKGTTWTVKRGDATTDSYFTFVLDSIWDNYKTAISKDTGIALSDLNKEDILEITLTPRKISRDNGGTYPYHIDCALSIKSKSAFTAKFWVKNPNDTGYTTQVDAKNYKTGEFVAQTTEVSIGNKQVIDGITYVLDGWYPENAAGGARGDQKITTWPYPPSDAELADGTVNFYAHYTPLYTSVKIKKLVTGNMGDKSKSFHFTVSVVNGNIKLPFKIDEESYTYTGSTTITLSDNQTITLTQVPVGATVTITEDDYYSNGRYTTSYTIDGNSSGTNNREAQIKSISRRDKDSAHEVIFTNNKEAIPDTGLNLGTTPYILALGIVALGACLLIFGRRKRQS